jgi:hypothetical protein
VPYTAPHTQVVEPLSETVELGVAGPVDVPLRRRQLRVAQLTLQHDRGNASIRGLARSCVTKSVEADDWGAVRTKPPEVGVLSCRAPERTLNGPRGGIGSHLPDTVPTRPNETFNHVVAGGGTLPPAGYPGSARLT